MSETAFMRRLMLALGRRSDMRIWRQNVGSIPVRDERGRIVRVFHTGVPKGAADISGYVRPEGWRLEIELKDDGCTRSPEQVTFARLVSQGGCVYALVVYDDALSMADNVAAAIRLVERAVAERRRSAA